MVDDSFWIDLEYKALREEMLSQAAAKEAAVRFYLPAAASVYAVPYLLNQIKDRFLWTVCAAVAGLLLLAMVRSLFVSTAAIRRIGAYVKEHIEPRTSGVMRWQHVVYCLDDKATYLGHSFTIAGIALIANVIASVAVDRLFGGNNAIGWSGIAAGLAAIISAPTLWLMSSPNELRRRYSGAVREIVTASADDSKPDPQLIIDERALSERSGNGNGVAPTAVG